MKRCGAVRYRGSDATEIWFVESEAHLAFSVNIRVPQAIDPARSGWFAAVLLGCLAIAGCATPVGVERVGPEIAYQKQMRNVLSSGDLSESSRIVLTRWNLAERFATDPEAAIATLQAKIANGTAGSDEIFALGELSFQHAERTGKRAYYLATAVYAFAFLFPDGTDASPILMIRACALPATSTIAA